MRVTLLVTGSIAAYKSAEIVRELKKRGHTVRVALSAGAAEFVTPLALQTLSGEPVATGLFDLEEESRIGHIALADQTDLVLVAPATAHFIAKAALGLADDLPSTILLATRAKVLVCPAMNVNMWENPVTQGNVELLKKRGVEILEPASGELACGWEGKGRLPDPEVIVSAVERLAKAAGEDLIGKRVIVTAGPTREMLDPIRFISNRSSGKMGIAIAREAARRGASVHLLLGPVQEPLERESYPVTNFTSAVDLKQKLETVLAEGTAEATLFMAAAPGDFRALEVSGTKLKGDKNKAQTLQLEPNEDIIRGIAERRGKLPALKTIVAFCAESASGETLEESAKAKLKAKGVDFIVGNSIAESFGTDFTSILLLGANGSRASLNGVAKTSAAAWLIDQVIERSVNEASVPK